MCSTPPSLKSILSSVSAVIEVSASASKINSTPFKSTAAEKSANLAEVIVASVIPVVPDIVDNEISNYGLLEKGEKYVITGGVPVGVPGTTNYLSVLRKN